MRLISHFKATVSGLSVHWQGRGYNGNEEDSTLLPPDSLISEEGLSRFVRPCSCYFQNVYLNDSEMHM